MERLTIANDAFAANFETGAKEKSAALCRIYVAAHPFGRLKRGVEKIFLTKSASYSTLPHTFFINTCIDAKCDGYIYQTP